MKNLELESAVIALNDIEALKEAYYALKEDDTESKERVIDILFEVFEKRLVALKNAVYEV